METKVFLRGLGKWNLYFESPSTLTLVGPNSERIETATIQEANQIMIQKLSEEIEAKNDSFVMAKPSH